MLSTKSKDIAARILRKYGLKFRAYNMVGLPGETVRNVYETIELNIQARTDFPFCSIFTPYWGTKLCDYAVERGLLDKKSNPDDFSANFNLGLILERFFQIVVLFPKLFPIAKKLAKLPNNIFFHFWFGLVFFSVFLRSERRPFFWTIWFGLRNLHFLLEKKYSTLKQNIGLN
mgnify:CR=1 FL=1